MQNHLSLVTFERPSTTDSIIHGTINPESAVDYKRTIDNTKQFKSHSSVQNKGFVRFLHNCGSNVDILEEKGEYCIIFIGILPHYEHEWDGHLSYIATAKRLMSCSNWQHFQHIPLFITLFQRTTNSKISKALIYHRAGRGDKKLCKFRLR